MLRKARNEMNKYPPRHMMRHRRVIGDLRASGGRVIIIIDVRMIITKAVRSGLNHYRKSMNLKPIIYPQSSHSGYTVGVIAQVAFIELMFYQ